MNERTPKLRKQKLNQLFLAGLDEAVLKHSEIDAVPLLIDLKPPFPLNLRVYLYNCTNPPGGRALDEYKIQVILPGQERGQRGSLDFSDGRMPILAAYACLADEVKDGVFVLWDAYKHEDFSYSANMQVKSDTIIKALSTPFSISKRSNNEIVIASRPQYLLKAIKYRVAVMREGIKEVEYES